MPAFVVVSTLETSWLVARGCSPIANMQRQQCYRPELDRSRLVEIYGVASIHPVHSPTTSYDQDISSHQPQFSRFKIRFESKCSVVGSIGRRFGISVVGIYCRNSRHWSARTPAPPPSFRTTIQSFTITRHVHRHHADRRHQKEIRAVQSAHHRPGQFRQNHDPQENLQLDRRSRDLRRSGKQGRVVYRAFGSNTKLRVAISSIMHGSRNPQG